MSLVPTWLKNARWAYKIGDWAGEFAYDTTAQLLVEVRVEMFTDTTFPADAMECHLHFTVDRSLEPAGFDRRPQLDALAQEVGEAVDALWDGLGGQISVFARIIQTSSETDVNRFETGVWIARPGNAPASLCPREVALCLSYFGARNLPGMRGRIFLPVAYSGSIALARPDQSLMADALDLGRAFAAAGGTGTQWSVYSRTQGLAFSITDSWVDDEWDTQRSRGLNPTARMEAKHDEAEVL